ISSTSHEGVTALGACMLVFSTLAIGLRFYARISQKAPLKTDDWLMIPSLFCMSFQFFLIVALGFIKLSALFFYYRIFTLSHRPRLFKGVIIGSVTVTILWTIAYILVHFLQCGTHFSALWAARAIKNKYCHISYPYLLSFAVSDFILDFWIIVLPVSLIWRIQSTIPRRLAITLVFLLAAVGFAACIARMVIYVQIYNLGPNAKTDSRLVNTKSIYLSILEIGLSCVAVNLPSLWFLFHKVTPENVLRSKRSQISLHSIHSSRPSQSDLSKATQDVSGVHVHDVEGNTTK
ncbi:hypothetical protein B0J14DRAFT_476102, partial [Halenospora varia]